MKTDLTSHRGTEAQRFETNFSELSSSVSLSLCGKNFEGRWLPDMDLNHDKQIQSLLCYRYTIGQAGAIVRLNAFAAQSSRAFISHTTHYATR
jgi:hypothetical protein